MNGQTLLGQLGAVLVSQQGPTVELTIERPVASEHQKIFLYEEDRKRKIQETLKGGEGEVSLLRQTALRLKRIMEAAVLHAHPEWRGSRVGEDVQAVSPALAASPIASLRAYSRKRDLLGGPNPSPDQIPSSHPNPTRSPSPKSTPSLNPLLLPLPFMIFQTLVIQTLSTSNPWNSTLSQHQSKP